MHACRPFEETFLDQHNSVQGLLLKIPLGQGTQSLRVEMVPRNSGEFTKEASGLEVHEHRAGKSHNLDMTFMLLANAQRCWNLLHPAGL